jgi:hydrogenase maturation protease
MLDLDQHLEALAHATVLWLGLGNPSGGDDAAGLLLAANLQAQNIPGVALVGLHPEQWLSRTEMPRGAHLIFLDAADLGVAPGSVAFLNANEMRARFPQISTHRIALGTLAHLAVHRGAAQAWLLGIQPASLRPGQALSPVVHFTLGLLERLILRRFGPNSFEETSARFSWLTPAQGEPESGLDTAEPIRSHAP